MKNKIITAVCIVLALVIAASAVAVYKKTHKPDPSGTKENELNATDDPDGSNEYKPAAAPADAKVITFIMPAGSFATVNQRNLDLFNEALYKDGHKYWLKIKYCDFENYQEHVMNEFKYGRADVASLGFREERGGNEIYDVIKSGVVLRLDDILSKGRGEVLYRSFPKQLWEAVKCDNGIYSIPTVAGSEIEVSAAFNRKYLSDAAIANWDGTIEGIYEMIKDVEWDDSKNPRFQYLMDYTDFDDMIGCEITTGLLYDYETMSVENPLESEKLIGYLKVLDQMKEEGFLSLTGSYIYDNDFDPKKYREEVEDRVKAGKFVAALGIDVNEEDYPEEFITVKRVKPYLSSRLALSVAISKNTDDVAAVVDFLCLLYADGKYANLLAFGEEGKDYKLIDGVVYHADGSEWGDDDILVRRLLNLYISVYPISGEAFRTDRKNRIFDYYDKLQLSPFIGFEPDTAKYNRIGDIMTEFYREVGQMNKPTAEVIAAAQQELKAAGYDEYLDSIRNQWEEFRK
ncbi:MAG: sugar ABC transporter substrate-binding protein [Lachnospiraceae bacterium]|nr:sugar ABC transporter substrate-binding protein [Lachnospiraceae bacterium]